MHLHLHHYLFLSHKLLDEVAIRYKLKLEDYEVKPDHVHVLAMLRPSTSPAKAVNLLKGYTSRALFLAEPEKLKGYYWRGPRRRSLWGAGKFMASVGHITLDKAKEYMNKQEVYHTEIPLTGIPTIYGWGGGQI